ncbi:unnamed protein product [Amoebophrya sp. A120]|nr:unnamed protein product [Amoebophrya sp. A120]|eukprot:GSA120T00014106001.1
METASKEDGNTKAATLVHPGDTSAGPSSGIKKLQSLRTRAAQNVGVLQKLWSTTDENKQDKFLRNVNFVENETVYKVSLDLWLSVERYGEPAVRIALETMLDRDCRNLVLNNDWPTLDRGDRFSQVVQMKKKKCKDNYLNLKSSSIDLENDWKLKFEELADEMEKLKTKHADLEKTKNSLQEQLWKAQAKLEGDGDEVQAKEKELTGQVEELEAELAKMRERASAFEDSNAAETNNLRDHLDDLEQKYSALQLELSTKDAKIEELSMAILKQQELMEEEQQKFKDQLQANTTASSNEEEEARVKKQQSVNEEEFQKRLERALKDQELNMKKQLQENATEVASVSKQLMENIKDLEKTLKDLELENEEVKNENKSLKQKLQAEKKASDSKIIELEQLNHQLETSLGELRIRLQELAKKISEAEGQGVDDLKDVLETSGLQKFLSDCSNSGKSIRKIHERLYQDFFNRAMRLQKLIAEYNLMREVDLTKKMENNQMDKLFPPANNALGVYPNATPTNSSVVQITMSGDLVKNAAHQHKGTDNHRGLTSPTSVAASGTLSSTGNYNSNQKPHLSIHTNLHAGGLIEVSNNAHTVSQAIQPAMNLPGMNGNTILKNRMRARSANSKRTTTSLDPSQVLVGTPQQLNQVHIVRMQPHDNKVQPMQKNANVFDSSWLIAPSPTSVAFNTLNLQFTGTSPNGSPTSTTNRSSTLQKMQLSNSKQRVMAQTVMEEERQMKIDQGRAAGSFVAGAGGTTTASSRSPPPRIPNQGLVAAVESSDPRAAAVVGEVIGEQGSALQQQLEQRKLRAQSEMRPPAVSSSASATQANVENNNNSYQQDASYRTPSPAKPAVWEFRPNLLQGSSSTKNRADNNHLGLSLSDQISQSLFTGAASSSSSPRGRTLLRGSAYSMQGIIPTGISANGQIKRTLMSTSLTNGIGNNGVGSTPVINLQLDPDAKSVVSGVVSSSLSSGNIGHLDQHLPHSKLNRPSPPPAAALFKKGSLTEIIENQNALQKSARARSLSPTISGVTSVTSGTTATGTAGAEMLNKNTTTTGNQLSTQQLQLPIHQTPKAPAKKLSEILLEKNWTPGVGVAATGNNGGEKTSTGTANANGTSSTTSTGAGNPSNVKQVVASSSSTTAQNLIRLQNSTGSGSSAEEEEKLNELPMGLKFGSEFAKKSSAIHLYSQHWRGREKVLKNHYNSTSGSANHSHSCSNNNSVQEPNTPSMENNSLISHSMKTTSHSLAPSFVAQPNSKGNVVQFGTHISFYQRSVSEDRSLTSSVSDNYPDSMLNSPMSSMFRRSLSPGTRFFATNSLVSPYARQSRNLGKGTASNMRNQQRMFLLRPVKQELILDENSTSCAGLVSSGGAGGAGSTSGASGLHAVVNNAMPTSVHSAQVEKMKNQQRESSVGNSGGAVRDQSVPGKNHLGTNANANKSRSPSPDNKQKFVLRPNGVVLFPTTQNNSSGEQGVLPLEGMSAPTSVMQGAKVIVPPVNLPQVVNINASSSTASLTKVDLGLPPVINEQEDSISQAESFLMLRSSILPPPKTNPNRSKNSWTNKNAAVNNHATSGVSFLKSNINSAAGATSSKVDNRPPAAAVMSSIAANNANNKIAVPKLINLEPFGGGASSGAGAGGAA